MSTSFIQFEYCSLCRLNHQNGKKHVFSRSHQSILKNIIEKFKRKILDAKADIREPVIKEHGWETGAQFWCYFCAREVEKHELLDGVTVKNGGILEHFSSASHLERTHSFWLEHRIDRSKKDQFILAEEDIQSFHVAVLPAIDLYKQKLEEKLQQTSSKIRRQVVKHQRTAELHRKLHESTDDDDDDDNGNVHTGATPPWMTDDRDTAGITTGREIGPTQQDYNKHLDLVKKSKLPATRVGAKFDHKEATGAHWLPMFGRVWSQNRRQHARQHFMKHTHGQNNKKKTRSEAFGRANTLCEDSNDRHHSKRYKMDNGNYNSQSFPISKDTPVTCTKTRPSEISHDSQKVQPSGAVYRGFGSRSASDGHGQELDQVTSYNKTQNDLQNSAANTKCTNSNPSGFSRIKIAENLMKKPF